MTTPRPDIWSPIDRQHHPTDDPPFPWLRRWDAGEVTTLALGEEGDDHSDPDDHDDPDVTTLALGEEGDDHTDHDDPDVTTLALGEEGDDHTSPIDAGGEQAPDPSEPAQTVAIAEVHVTVDARVDLGGELDEPWTILVDPLERADVPGDLDLDFDLDLDLDLDLEVAELDVDDLDDAFEL